MGKKRAATKKVGGSPKKKSKSSSSSSSNLILDKSDPMYWVGMEPDDKKEIEKVSTMEDKDKSEFRQAVKNEYMIRTDDSLPPTPVRVWFENSILGQRVQCESFLHVDSNKE